VSGSGCSRSRWLWGGSFFFAKVALDALAPFTVVFCRVALAALALNIINPLRRSAPWGAFFAMGALNNVVPFALIFWGQTHIASGLASILNATTPLFTAVVAHFLTADEKLTRAKCAALVAGLAGVVFLVGPDFLAGARTGVAGQLACLGAALSYAFAGIYGRRFRTMGVASLEAAAGQVTASALLILPIMLIIDRPWLLPAAPSIEVWAALAGLSLLSTALAYVLYFRVLAAAGATNLLLVTFLIPVTALLLGAAFLDERAEPRHFLGMGFIPAGLALIDGRIWRLARPAK
jgi:drug/metabolite transporter (DMT)-like permease